MINHPADDFDDLVDILINVDPKLLMRKMAQDTFINGQSRKDVNLFWAPTKERQSFLFLLHIQHNLHKSTNILAEGTIEPFLTKYPHEYFNSDFKTDVDVLLGYSSDVG